MIAASIGSDDDMSRAIDFLRSIPLLKEPNNNYENARIPARRGWMLGLLELLRLSPQTAYSLMGFHSVTDAVNSIIVDFFEKFGDIKSFASDILVCLLHDIIIVVNTSRSCLWCPILKN